MLSVRFLFTGTYDFKYPTVFSVFQILTNSSQGTFRAIRDENVVRDHPTPLKKINALLIFLKNMTKLIVYSETRAS